VIRGSYGVYYVGMPLSSHPAIHPQHSATQFAVLLIILSIILTFPAVRQGPTMAITPLLWPPHRPTTSLTLQWTLIRPRDLTRLGMPRPYWDPRAWNDEHQQTWNLTVEHELPAQIGFAAELHRNVWWKPGAAVLHRSPRAEV